jgi:tRNA nucleotidyltransferase (CCA-adding enzyme)
MSDPASVKLPSAVASLLAALDGHGWEAHVVGPGADALLRGEPTRDFEVATSADARDLLERFAAAIPLDSARSRLLLPTGAGPVELVPHAMGGGIRATLARRDFTLHAIGIDAMGRTIDPFDGRADAEASRLRCVGRAADRFSEDPLRRLRAVRLVATRGLDPDPELVRALSNASRPLAGVAATRLRAELHALLLGAHVDRGLGLLRSSGLEAALAEGVGEDAAGVVAALAPDLELRLAGWLRGARAVRTLRRLREPRPRVLKIERLLQLHPIEDIASPEQEARLARLARRAASLVPGLLALREAEITARGEGSAARACLDQLREAIARAQDPDAPSAGPTLALDGREVMEILGCGPGPEVGRALRQLEKDVSADPTCNTREALRERLLAWLAANTE